MFALALAAVTRGAALGWRRAIAARGDAALAVIALSLLALGVWVRAQKLGVPADLGWDEHHFVHNAQNYLAGRVDWNDHPPLGKLVIALGIRGFGDTAFGWRIGPMVFGLVNIALAALLARRLFAGWRAPLLAAAFVAGDGFFIAYSRAALLDGMVATFALAAACVIVGARRAWHVALACGLVGLGCAVKISLLPLFAPIAWVTLVKARAPRWSFAFVLVVPLVVGAIWSYGLMLSDQPHSVRDVLSAARAMIEHHAGLNDGKHPYVSRWYTWFLPLKPITMRFEQVGQQVRVMSAMGNTLLWWSASAAVLSVAAAVEIALVKAVRARRAGEPQPWAPLAALDGSELWLFALWFAFVFPWMVSSRDSYVYHYLPAYGFALVLVAGMLARAFERWPRRALATTAVLAALSFWMAPIWAELPVSRTGYVSRVWFPGWRRKVRAPGEPPPASTPHASTRSSASAY